MSEIVKIRLMEVCPAKKVSEMTPDELDSAINVAFKIIGYKPIDLMKAKQKAFDSKSEWLCDFIYEVWRNDN